MAQNQPEREHRFFSFIKSALRDTVQSIEANHMMGIASVVSIVAALLILGIFVIFSANLQEVTMNVEAALELKAFLVHDVTDQQVKDLEKEILKNPKIDSVEFESADDALADFADSLEEYSGLLDGYNSSNNPMQASYTVRIHDSEDIDDVKAYCEGLKDKGVDYVKYGEEYVDALVKFSDYSRIFCGIMIGVLTAISIFIIYNTIRLTCFARRKEIQVMRYVGAPNWYIRLPFVFEGTFLGMIGAVAAMLVIRTGYYFLIAYVNHSVYMPMNSTLVAPSVLLMPISWACLIYGILVGAVGSVFSMRKFLKV